MRKNGGKGTKETFEGTNKLNIDSPLLERLLSRRRYCDSAEIFCIHISVCVRAAQSAIM